MSKGANSMPTRDEILRSIRERNNGHLIEQVIGLEADKIELINEVRLLRLRIEDLERQLAKRPMMAEPE